MKMVEEIGEFIPDKLFAGAEVVAITIGCELSSGQGAKRGTVLCKDSNDKYKKVETLLEVPSAILTDSINTGIISGNGVIATAYISGMFNKNALIFGDELKYDEFELELRKLNIYAKDVKED